MILLLLATAIVLSDVTKTVDGIFLQRKQPATGKMAVSTIGPGYIQMDPPDDPRRRMVERTDAWVIVHETQAPATQRDPLRKWVRFYPLVGAEVEPLFPSEKIALVRHGANVGTPIRRWSPKQNLQVRDINDDRKWLPVGATPLVLGQYHEDGDGLSMGGEISARLEGERLEVVVTHAGSWRNDQGEGGYVHEETIYSYPLDWLPDGKVGQGYGTLVVKIRAAD